MSAGEPARRDNLQELFELRMLNRAELATELAQSAEPQPEEDSRRELIEAAIAGASEKTLAVLLAFARRPGESLTIEEIAASMPMLHGRALDTRSIGGVLGAFAGMAKRRGVGRGLLEVRWDDRVGRYRYRMAESVAVVVTEVARRRQKCGDGDTAPAASYSTGGR